jgi:peptidoglycan/LPS O-acetylase OafA/YrhL
MILKRQWSFSKFFLNLCDRLTPLYASVLAFLATIWPHIGTGPDWSFVQKISKSIRNYWWAHMLYVNNYVRHPSASSPDFAFGETWYLACDMQMFWLSPLFIYPIWRWKRTGVIWIAICLLFFLGASATVFIVYGVIPTVLLVRS